MYDVLLKGGEIVDPAQGIHATGAVGIRNGKIALVEKGEPDVEAAKVYDMTGKVVAPGLIDMHCHPSEIFMSMGARADDIGLATGVTLLGDGGSAGAPSGGDQV